MKSRLVASLMIGLATAASYCLIGLCLLSALEIFGAPVGVGKTRFFSLIIVPATLLVVGWIQGKIVFIFHFLTIPVTWLAVGRVGAPFAIGGFVDNPIKEQSLDTFFAGYICFLLCGIGAAIWNSSLRARGLDVVLSIPFHENFVLWPERRNAGIT